MRPREHTSSKLDIYTMPLIEVPDTEGLERRLQHALGRIGLEENELVQASIALGLKLHENDRRTYERYNNHLLRVTLRLIEDLDVTDVVLLAATPLHDSVEDHLKELVEQFLGGNHPHLTQELGRQALQKHAMEYAAPEIADEMADIVLTVTNPLLRPGTTRTAKIESYNGRVGHIMKKGPPRPRVLKMGDVTDNVDVPAGLEDPRKRDYLDEKQREILPLVQAALMLPDDLTSEEGRRKVLGILNQRQSEANERLNKRAA